MRTNDLFRDLLEGRQPLPTRREQLRQEVLARALATWPETMVAAFGRFADAVALTTSQVQTLANALGWDEQPPADPRARALWAKQQQGHGPAMTPLRVRGRTTHYKEKG